MRAVLVLLAIAVCVQANRPIGHGHRLPAREIVIQRPGHVTHLGHHQLHRPIVHHNVHSSHQVNIHRPHLHRPIVHHGLPHRHHGGVIHH